MLESSPTPREMAEKCRRLARDTLDQATIEALLKLAADYDAEADKAEPPAEPFNPAT